MQNLRKLQPPEPPYRHQVVTIDSMHGLWVGIWALVRCVIYMQCTYMKNQWSDEAAVLCDKCLCWRSCCVIQMFLFGLSPLPHIHMLHC